MELMRAVLVTRFGGTEVLCPAEVERPSPISTEVPVRVIYPPESERVTHFHSVRDPARIVYRVLYTLATAPRQRG